MTDYQKNFGFKHKSGILLAVSSLPSPYGIGSFGRPSFDFIDFLDATGTKCWQILPLNPTAYGDSPYQSPAAFALNPYFIDLEILRSDGLLTKEELASAKYPSDRVDYGRLFNERYPLLRRAFSRFSPDTSYRAFCKRNAEWLSDYAFFMALKVRNGYRSWIEWDDEYKYYSRALKHIEEHRAEMDFWSFLQYEADSQWREVRDYARKKGIKIIGDMPIYVAYDSVDVWSDTSQFLLDDNLNPIRVAGCPPDGFAPDGQLWGNPIYDYEKMLSDGYSWWIRRTRRSFRLYDIVRIDHFRGFAGYYSIPYGDSTARNGSWQQGPGEKLFDAVSAAVPDAKIIAEDLGFITDDVRQLLKYCGFPGMKNLQFAFFDDDSEYLPRTYASPNCVVYTGTHDADCTYSWCRELSGDVLKRFQKERPHKKGVSRTYSMIYMAFESVANLAVVPLQDWQLLPNEVGKMNTPSVAEGNWSWRASPRYASRALINKISEVTRITGRKK